MVDRVDTKAGWPLSSKYEAIHTYLHVHIHIILKLKMLYVIKQIIYEWKFFLNI